MSDLTLATRELFVRTLKAQVLMQLPFYEELERRNKITFKGGKYIERLVDMDNMDDLAQDYTVNDALTDEAKDFLAKPRFTWKLTQIPLRYDANWEIQNADAGNEEQLLDLPQLLVRKAQEGARLKMMKNAFNAGVTIPRADGGDSFQSLVSALDHDNTYGTLSRSFSGGTRDYWQGASPSGLNNGQTTTTTAAQDVAVNLTISNLRKWIWESDIAHYVQSMNDIYVMMCPTLFNKLRSEMDSRVLYKQTSNNTGTQKQGFQKMDLDGHQIVSVPYLQESSTTRTWVFILNMNDWELRISNARNFKITDFDWQGKYVHGHDYYLARLLIAGNLVCWKPNGNMWLSAVS